MGGIQIIPLKEKPSEEENETGWEAVKRKKKPTKEELVLRLRSAVHFGGRGKVQRHQVLKVLKN